MLIFIFMFVGRDDEQQRIPAHRFILSIGSAVFDAMFNSELATKDNEISLPDVEPASFLALLRFLYYDDVQIGPETVMTTLYTAKKYAVPALEKHCVDFLKHNLSADNAFMLLTQVSNIICYIMYSISHKHKLNEMAMIFTGVKSSFCICNGA